MRYFLLLAATCGLSAAAPQLAPAPAGYEAPVVTGYFRPMLEVPGLAAQEQESSGDVSLSTGTGAVVQTFPFYSKYSKREAKANPALVYSAYPYAAAAYGAYAYGSYPYAYGSYAYLG